MARIRPALLPRSARGPRLPLAAVAVLAALAWACAGCAGGGAPVAEGRAEGRADDLAAELKAAQRIARAESQRAERLEREAGRLQRDLIEAEEALVTAESGPGQSHTRAEVVTAAAEARIQVERASTRLPWDPQLIEVARARLATCEQELAEGHLGAAMYFATRAASTAEGALAEAGAAAADPDALRVGAARVNLREGPSVDTRVLRVLVAGTPVFPESQSGGGEWTRIRTLRGHTGWIHTPLLH